MVRFNQRVRWNVAMLTVAAVVASPAGIGCSGSPDSTSDAGGDTDRTGALVEEDSWSQTSAADDPLASHRPESVECPEEATGQEELNGEPSLSIDTSNCNYFSGRQPSLSAIEKGDQLEARLWHFALTGEEGTEAHAAIVIDGEVVWETTVDIPSEEGELLNPTWTAESDVPAGAPVTFHLHNHGDNQWNFIELVNNGPSE